MALAAEWFRPGRETTAEERARLWLVMTVSEKRRFEELARAAVEAYVEAVGEA